MLTYPLKYLFALVMSVLCAALAPIAAHAADSWWSGGRDWSYRKAITIDTSPSGANLSGAIGRTVVLVRLHSGNFTFTDSADNGADLRIVDSDNKTPLPFHIESFDHTNGLATIWVSVPNLNGGEKHQIWLYFGNKNAPVAQDAAGTFDPDYTAVYHFAQNAGQAAADVTANANNAANAPAGIDDSGIIGRSARFPGQGELQVAASPSLAMPASAPMTFTAWIKPAQLAGEQAIFARGALVFGLNNGVPFVTLGAGRAQAAAPVKQNEWTQVALTSDGNVERIYVNGVEAASATAPMPALDGPISIGGAAGRPFNGEIDEARLSKTARPAAMLMAMFQSEGAGGKLVSVSESAEKPSSGGGTLFFIIGKVELVDGIIIGICLIMLAIAIVVMVTKSRYIAAVKRGNAAFLRRFRALHEDLVPIPEMPGVDQREAEALAGSPLGHVYETGMEELEVRRRRLGRGVALSGEAVEAMRAAVDAVVVEENQKLDIWMVLLTIAISGGPFVGLLGTVMGVMNTFAGVALAGDVNVNAIAPGIAAALLATIAGLSCAIPSLFGYNYLNTQIATVSDELRVFVDRLITRLAEMQREDAPPPARMAAE